MRAISLRLMVYVWLVVSTLSEPLAASCTCEDPAVLAKIKALQDRNNPERDRIVRELGELGPRAKTAIPALMDVLKEEADLRVGAARALGEIGAAAVPLLIKALNDPDKSVRLAAIFGLQWAEANAKPAVPILVKLLRTGDMEVRIQVTGALSWIPCPESVQALADELVSERDYGVRWRVADCLSELGPEGKAALPSLAKVLREMNALQKMDPLPNVLNSGPPGWLHAVPDLDLRVGRAFKKIGEGAVPTLVELLNDPDKDFRCRALEILEDIGPHARTSVPAVMKCLEDKEPEVRLRAAVTLSQLGRDALLALPALRRAMRDPSIKVRLEVACTILRLNPPADEALAILLDGMRDRERDVRCQAIGALRWLGLREKRVMDALVVAADDPDDRVRSIANRTLAEIRKAQGVEKKKDVDR